MTLFSLSICMMLSGASGMIGAVFEVRSPVTFFALMLLLQCCLEIAWFFLEALQKRLRKAISREDKTSFKGIFVMLWNEVVLGHLKATLKLHLKPLEMAKQLAVGGRSAENSTAVNLFYSLLSLNVHLWACGIVASYALELRIMGKAVWFEVEDDSEEEKEPTSYGATQP